MARNHNDVWLENELRKAEELEIQSQLERLSKQGVPSDVMNQIYRRLTDKLAGVTPQMQVGPPRRGSTEMLLDRLGMTKQELYTKGIEIHAFRRLDLPTFFLSVKGKGVLVTDDPDLCPSDALVSKIRLLMNG